MFRKKRSIKLPEIEQGFIFFLCWTVKKQPKEIDERIKSLCKEICGNEWKILYKVLTDRYRTLDSIADENYMQRKKLSYWRTIFFETYANRYLQ